MKCLLCVQTTTDDTMSATSDTTTEDVEADADDLRDAIIRLGHNLSRGDVERVIVKLSFRTLFSVFRPSLLYG